MSNLPHLSTVNNAVVDEVRDELKSALEYVGEEDLSKNLNHAVLALCGRFLLGDQQLMIPSERRRALQTLSLLLRVMNAVASEGKGRLRTDSSLTKCTVTLSLSEFREVGVETDSTISLLCDVLRQSLLLMDEWERDEWIVRITTQCENSLGAVISGEVTSTHIPLKPEASLRILEVVLESLTSSLSPQQSSDIDDDCKSPAEELSPLINVQNIKLHQVFTELVFGPHEGVSAHLLVVLIPLLVKVEGSAQLLRELWEAICAKGNEDVDSQTLGTICALADFYVPEDKRSASTITFPLIHRPKFWQLLQLGICADQPLLRKQALYLLKRAIDGLTKRQKQINFFEFYWNTAISNQLQAAWQDLFLVLEALEETQTHLVRPVLSILARLLNIHINGTECMCLSWILCAFQRVLSHPSQSINIWGVETLLGGDGLSLIAGSEAGVFVKFFIKNILPALNSSSIFNMETGVREVLSGFLSNAVHQEIAPILFSQVLSRMAALSWGPVPLYHITEAMAKVPAVKLWHGTDLIQLHKLITITLATQSVIIRAATQSQLLTSLMNFLDPNNVDLSTLCDLFSVFRSDECLHRGTEAWTCVVDWLTEFVDIPEAQQWLALCGEKSERYDAATARFVVLLLDAGKLESLEPLRPALKSVKDCETRLYACQEAQNGCVQLLAHLMQESNSLETESQNDGTRTAVVTFVSDALVDILTLFHVRLQSALDLSAFNSTANLLHSLEVLIMDPAALPHILYARNSLTLLSSAFDILKTYEEHVPLKIYFSVMILKIFACAKRGSSFTGGVKLIADSVNVLLSSGLLGQPVITNRDSKLPQELLEHQGHLVSVHTQVVWELLGAVPDLLKGLDDQRLASALDAADCALELGGRSALAPVLNVLVHILPRVSTSSQSLALQLLQQCWNAVLELRRNELFWPALDAFLSAVFQPALVLNSGWAQKFALKCGRELVNLGDSVCGVANLLVASLQSLAKYCLLSLLQSPLRELVLSALLFGPVHRKDQRAVNETCEHIALRGGKCAANVLLSHGERSDGGVRAGAIQILVQTGMGSEPWRQKISEQLVTDLLNLDSKPGLRRSRYFGDSQLHRCKHRILQGILLLEPSLSQERKHVLASWAKDRLLNENHQPSVRYQTEWLLVRLLCALPSEQAAIWETFRKAQELRAGAVCSLIGVVLHTVLMLEYLKKSDNSLVDLETFLDSTFEALLPCTMAQHFNVRLHGQVAILQVWKCVERLALHTIQSRYEVVVRGVRSSLKQASGAGHTRHQQDFYFHAFHPSQHYTLQTLFEELPRLSNVARDEWVTLQQLRSSGVTTGNNHISLSNCDTRLQNFESSPWVQRPSTGNSCEMDGAAEGAVLQKKMIPWKWMDPTEELIRSLPESLQQRKLSSTPNRLLSGGNKSSLVVVASLIDKAPNLGGLARTCEIMGASLVLPSLSCAQEREFRALSMSAEMWIPICEVKPHQLSQFLTDMKNTGFRLIGAEQTAASIPLNGATFPANTLLLLGNEREGIPAHLLPLLDQCIEVPQFGVVRSLNVHVTGALFMWQYACQHFLGSKNEMS